MSQDNNEPDGPIRGPSPVGPEYELEPDWDKPMSAMLKVGRGFADIIRKPAHWMRQNIVEPNRGPRYYWYHRKYKRALPVDECYIDDHACIYEAELEYRRNFKVDRAVLDLLRNRRDNCYFWYSTRKGAGPGPSTMADECLGISRTYHEAEDNFHIKYGEMNIQHSVLHAYNKQKHRMIIERRKRLRDEQKRAEQQPE